VTGLSFPRIRVSGGPFERGHQYGVQATKRIEQSIAVYRAVFKHYAEWDWAQVTGHARTYADAIGSYRPHFLDEMRGIADGASLSLEDILALNVRTEVMFAAVARAAARECTAFVALPETTRSGRVLVGQNWDWKPDTAAAVVLLEVEPDEGPRYVTVVEAGLLAKTGMNSAGLGLVTNAMVSNQDAGKPAVPYHAVLRAILESESPSAALDAITRHPRASSANYLIAHRDGAAINAEATPGDYSRVFLDYPQGGVYGHGNHFIAPGFDLKDVGIWDGPDSPWRTQRMQRLLEQRRGKLDLAAMKEILADHFNLPYAICMHAEPSTPRVGQYATVASVIMDLERRTMWLADGNPCQTPYQRLDYSSFLS